MNARELVTSHIAGQARTFPELEIAPLDTAGLDGRDAALARAIDHAVVRRWLTLQAIIQKELSRPWEQVEPKLQASLLVGAAQLLLLDRLPDHAVINETVEWAKRRVRSKAGGLINAVLRKIAGLRAELTEALNPKSLARNELPIHDGRVWRLSEDVFAGEFVPRLAQQTSHPDE